MEKKGVTVGIHLKLKSCEVYNIYTHTQRNQTSANQPKQPLICIIHKKNFPQTSGLFSPFSFS